MKREGPRSQRLVIRVVWLCVISCGCLVVTLNVHAAQQDDLPVESDPASKDETLQRPSWEPPLPAPDTFDWIQLTSGEWLKGELKTLYEGTLEFDSDKLDLQEFDWEDVKQVRGHRLFSVRFEGPMTVDGLIQVTENTVMVTVGEDQQEFTRDHLVAIAPVEEQEIDYWSAKIGFGFNLARGNTDQIQYNATANISRRTSATRVIADYSGNLTQTEGVEIVNNHTIQGYADVFKTRHYFFRPVFGQYVRDPFKNIAHRVAVGGGIGYHLINTSKTEWDIAGGPAYQTTQFVSVEPGEASREWTPAVVAGTHFHTELSKSIDGDVRYSFLLVNEASGTYNHHWEATLETQVTHWLEVDISFVWNRIQHPTPDAEGTVPKQDDFSLILSLEIDR